MFGNRFLHQACKSDPTGAVILIVPAAIGFLWVSTSDSLGLFVSVLVALGAGGANFTSLVILASRTASPA